MTDELKCANCGHSEEEHRTLYGECEHGFSSASMGCDCGEFVASSPPTPPATSDERQQSATRAAEQTESGATGRTDVAGPASHDGAGSSRIGAAPTSVPTKPKKCEKCFGRGYLDCDDSQCGDSTWDHDCNDGATCTACSGKSFGEQMDEYAASLAVRAEGLLALVHRLEDENGNLLARVHKAQRDLDDGNACFDTLEEAVAATNQQTRSLIKRAEGLERENAELQQAGRTALNTLERCGQCAHQFDHVHAAVEVLRAHLHLTPK